MSSFDVEAALAPISAEAPCGVDLSGEPAYLELDRLVQGTPERQIGNTIVPAQEPDWRQLYQRCTELLARSKDLRVALYLSLALLKQQGLPGLRDGLSFLRGLIERHWESLYPRLDPEDDNDPLERMNILAAFAPAATGYGDPLQFRQRVRET